MSLISGSVVEHRLTVPLVQRVQPETIEMSNEKEKQRQRCTLEL